MITHRAHPWWRKQSPRSQKTSMPAECCSRVAMQAGMSWIILLRSIDRWLRDNRFFRPGFSEKRRPTEWCEEIVVKVRRGLLKHLENSLKFPWEHRLFPTATALAGDWESRFSIRYQRRRSEETFNAVRSGPVTFKWWTFFVAQAVSWQAINSASSF